MSRTRFDAETKAQAIKLIQANTSNKDIEAQLGIPPTTVSNWRAELKKKNGSGGKKRRTKMNGAASIHERLGNVEFTLSLHELENDTLRKLVNEPDPRKRDEIELDYLRKRLALFGDKWVKPLWRTAEESAELS